MNEQEEEQQPTQACRDFLLTISFADKAEDNYTVPVSNFDYPAKWHKLRWIIEAEGFTSLSWTIKNVTATITPNS